MKQAIPYFLMLAAAVAFIVWNQWHEASTPIAPTPGQIYNERYTSAQANYLARIDSTIHEHKKDSARHTATTHRYEKDSIIIRSMPADLADLLRTGDSLARFRYHLR